MKAAARRFVLDASVAVAWCFDDESTPFTEGVLQLLAGGAEAVTPALWALEVANALLVAERRHRTTVAEVTGFLQSIATLPIHVEATDQDRAFQQVLAVARQQRLSEYDAAYLELALRESLPLATLDGQLRKAAGAVGITLVTV